MLLCLTSVWNWAFAPRPSAPPQPKCSGIGVRLLQERREKTDRKYTDRPADLWPSYGVSRAQLERARARAEEVDKLFQQYKREASCQVNREENGGQRCLRKCDKCKKYTCNACRFHDDYFIVSSDPLIFETQLYSPCSARIPDDRFMRLHTRLRDYEHPYQLALLMLFAQRWHGYCNDCFPRVSASLVKARDGQFKFCKCSRATAGLEAREDWVCLQCFEKACDGVATDFNHKKCRGPRCQKFLWELLVDDEQAFKPVCNWCSRVVAPKDLKDAQAALFEGREFEKRRLDFESG